MVEVHFSCHQLPLAAQGPYCDAPQGSVFPETPIGVFPIISNPRLYLPVPPSRHQCAASLWEWPALQNSWASLASISRENNAPCQGDAVRETEENLVPKGATHGNGLFAVRKTFLGWRRFCRVCAACPTGSYRKFNSEKYLLSHPQPSHKYFLLPSVTQPQVVVLKIHFFWFWEWSGFPELPTENVTLGRSEGGKHPSAGSLLLPLLSPPCSCSVSVFLSLKQTN